MEAATKTCPMCAEDVKAAALLCRFCGHRFVAEPGQVPARPSPDSPPGWYPDPERERGQRWWDGSQWTKHKSQDTLLQAGVFFALVIPIVGFAIGCVLLSKDRIGPGLAVMGTSFLSFLVVVSFFL